MTLDPVKHALWFFRTAGQRAVYTPVSGSAYDVRAFSVTKADRLPFSSVRMFSERRRFHVLRSEITAPAAGDTLSVSGSTWTVQAVIPVDGETDAYALRWSLEVAWGPSISLNPTKGQVWTVNVNGVTNLGAAHVTLKNVPAGLTATVIGDKFTVSPFPESYTISSAVTTTAGALTSVPFSPALLHALADGATVTVTRTVSSITLNAMVLAYTALEVNATTVLATDARVLMLTSLLGSYVPVIGDTVTLNGKSRGVKNVSAIYYGGAVIAYDCQVGA